MSSNEEPHAHAAPPPHGSADESKARRKGSVAPRSFRGRLMAGILLIMPLAVTAILIRAVYDAALYVGASVANWIWWAVLRTQQPTVVDPADPSDKAPRLLIDPADPEWMDVAMAVGLTVLLLYLLGWLGSNVVGRRVIDAAENLFERIPFVDTIYGALKRMIRALSGSAVEGAAEKRPVMIDFPTENMKALAFMTNVFTDRNSGQRYVTVFVPTTPNPTSGYMEIVPIERVTETDLTMDQALSMILSGGATAPSNIGMKRMDFRPPPGASGPPATAGPAGTDTSKTGR